LMKKMRKMYAPDLGNYSPSFTAPCM